MILKVPTPDTEGEKIDPETAVPEKVPPAGVAVRLKADELVHKLGVVSAKLIVVVGLPTVVVIVCTELQLFASV